MTVRSDGVRGRRTLLPAILLLGVTACGAAASPAASSEPAHSTPTPRPSATPTGAAPPRVAAVLPSPTPSLPTTAASARPVPPPVRIVVLPPPTSRSGPVTGAGALGGCAVFPASNAWNQDISAAPLSASSAAYVARVDSYRAFVHPDFGSNPAYGIPFVVVPQNQPPVPITFTAYGAESDPGPYPVPLNAPVEQGSDAHVLVLQSGSCRLYEMFGAQRSGNGWNAASGAVFDLRSNALRPDRWTSADAAGLPILPGLVRYDEVAAGVINHALRFTVDQTQNGFIHPATHQAGVANAADPPMGARFRLKASFDLTPYHGESLVILTALKRYGMIVADNGSSWFVSGATDSRWNDADLNQLKGVPGSAFEVVQTGPIQH